MVGRTRSREDAKGSGWEELHGFAREATIAWTRVDEMLY